MRLRRHLILVIALIAVVPTFVAPGSAVAQWAYALAFSFFVVQSWIAVRRRTGRARVAHGLIAAALSVWLIADLLYASLVWWYGELADGVSVADFLWISGYPPLAAGLIQMVRLRATRRLREATLDGLAMVVVVGALFWQFVVQPSFGDDGIGLSDVVMAFYPFGDVLLFAAGALLVLSPRGNHTLVRYLTTALTITLVADVIMSLTPAWFPESGIERLDGLLLLANSVFAAVLWHPDAGQAADPRAADRGRLHPARVIFLGVSLLALPALAGLRNDDVVLGRGTIMTSMVLITCIVLVRFTLVVRSQEKIREVLAHRATHDELTGLVNRQELHARLTSALASGELPVVHFLDLDGFKQINDGRGHAVGDHVLKEISRRLLATARHTDTVARLGGDEFVVVTRSADATAMVERLRQAVTAPILCDDGSLAVGVSIGVAMPAGPEGSTSDALLAAADAAMYREKSSCRPAYASAPPAVAPSVSESTASAAP